jgi:hypothetical protein
MSQVVIEVFVHQDRPVVGRRGAEERMRVSRAARRARGGEAVDQRE